MHRNEFLETRANKWEALMCICYWAWQQLNGKVKEIPHLHISVPAYRLMQADAMSMDCNPLELQVLDMPVHCDERLQHWEAEIRPPNAAREDRYFRLIFNCLKLFPELSGRKDLVVITVQPKESVVCTATGATGPGVSVLLEGPGGGTQFCLCTDAAFDLSLKLDGSISGDFTEPPQAAPSPLADAILDDAPEPMKADEVPAPSEPVVAGDGGDTDPAFNPPVSDSVDGGEQK